MAFTTLVLLNGFSGLLEATLGVWMLCLRPRNAGTLCFGLFGLGAERALQLETEAARGVNR
ncbi:MAG: hypothetical protein HY556_01140 [Euryarchaeota archaeon]|nr:hypothetical protein [Euryarchaeota archaeon]